MRDPVKRLPAVMGEEVRNIFKQEDFWAIVAKLPNEADNFEEAPPPHIIEAKLGSCNGEWLTGETRCEHVYGGEIVADD